MSSFPTRNLRSQLRRDPHPIRAILLIEYGEIVIFQIFIRLLMPIDLLCGNYSFSLIIENSLEFFFDITLEIVRVNCLMIN